MVSSQSRIGIIGAGTSGVYLAILLIKQGFQVTLFEKAPPSAHGWLWYPDCASRYGSAASRQPSN
ncbi:MULTISPECIES: NAD(P)-binding protein [unclassified Microcoleus]|uniref:NAD(P)-binding protein n=1 Tax=unclassified Microcoleus TaxID=2642155 RepID=UPI00403F3472